MEIPKLMKYIDLDNLQNMDEYEREELQTFLKRILTENSSSFCDASEIMTEDDFEDKCDIYDYRSPEEVLDEKNELVDDIRDAVINVLDEYKDFIDEEKYDDLKSDIENTIEW